MALRATTVVQGTELFEESTARSFECAQGMGECSIDELVDLEEQLAMINDECLMELAEHDLCDDDMFEGREILKKTLGLQHELHQLEQQLKGMPFAVDTNPNQAKISKTADDHWFIHYVETYHW